MEDVVGRFVTLPSHPQFRLEDAGSSIGAQNGFVAVDVPREPQLIKGKSLDEELIKLSSSRNSWDAFEVFLNIPCE